MTPEEWAAAEQAMNKRHERERKEMHKELARVEEPDICELRPATVADVRVGAVIYHRHNDAESRYWNVVAEVNYPGDEFKAYTADDGCRYGMAHAMVKKRSHKCRSK